MKHVFSIDVEDWYQGIELPINTWGNYEKRIQIGVDRLLSVLADTNSKATCFILGSIAEMHPGIVKKIANAGHEVATHGQSHEKIYELTKEQFKERLHKSVCLLEDLTGEKVLGHRAPYFSIIKSNLWALDVLLEEGIIYDSSIHPVKNYRYGIPDAQRTLSVIKSETGKKMLEIPVSTYPFKKFNLPVGGGAYLRIYPYWILKNFLTKLEKRNETISIYVHPWELDYDHPKIALPKRVSLTHYHNLRSTEPKLRKLLSDFNFTTFREAFVKDIKELL